MQSPECHKGSGSCEADNPSAARSRRAGAAGRLCLLGRLLERYDGMLNITEHPLRVTVVETAVLNACRSVDLAKPTNLQAASARRRAGASTSSSFQPIQHFCLGRSMDPSHLTVRENPQVGPTATFGTLPGTFGESGTETPSHAPPGNPHVVGSLGELEFRQYGQAQSGAPGHR